MATVQEILSLAYKQVGYVETPDNKTKYSRKFGVRVAQWCGYFVDWLFVMCDMDEPTCAYTPNGAAGFKKRGRLYSEGRPTAGDILFYDFPNDGLDRISHTGIVVKMMRDGDVLAIEGNTTGNGSIRADERNGGMVAIKKRPMKFVVAWGKPNYEVAPAPIVEVIAADFLGEPLPKPAAKKPKPVANKKLNKTHKVISGDTLWDIAIKNQVTVSQLRKANLLDKKTALQVGMKLIIPAPTKAGKTLARVFKRRNK